MAVENPLNSNPGEIGVQIGMTSGQTDDVEVPLQEDNEIQRPAQTQRPRQRRRPKNNQAVRGKKRRGKKREGNVQINKLLL